MRILTSGRGLKCFCLLLSSCIFLLCSSVKSYASDIPNGIFKLNGEEYNLINNRIMPLDTMPYASAHYWYKPDTLGYYVDSIDNAQFTILGQYINVHSVGYAWYTLSGVSLSANTPYDLTFTINLDDVSGFNPNSVRIGNNSMNSASVYYSSFEIVESSTTSMIVTFNDVTYSEACDVIELSYDFTPTSSTFSIYASSIVDDYIDESEQLINDIANRDDDRSIEDASSKFTSEFEELHENENYLIEESEYIFDDFFTSFNWSALEEYLNGFQFIGTWFGNFYNSHSAVGVMVGMSAGLTLLFVLLRFRGH